MKKITIAIVALMTALTCAFMVGCSGDKIKVGVQTGTTGEFYVKGNADMLFDGYENLECMPYSNGGLAVKAMLEGQVEYVIIDNGPAKQLVEQNKGIKMIDIALSTEKYAFGVDKNQPELLASVNSFIAADLSFILSKNALIFSIPNGFSLRCFLRSSTGSLVSFTSFSKCPDTLYSER